MTTLTCDAKTRNIKRYGYIYLIRHEYTDPNDKITQIYHGAKKDGQLATLPQELALYTEQIFQLIDSVFSDAHMPEIVDERRVRANPINNANFHKKEFKELWDRINHKAVYTVDFETPELVKKCTTAFNEKFTVSSLQYTLQRGEQTDTTTYDELVHGEAFFVKQNKTEYLVSSLYSVVKYDLIGKLSQETQLTRKTIANILQGINADIFNQYKINPEDFIFKAGRLINDEKATIIIEHLSYDVVAENYSSDIFTQEKLKEDFSKAVKTNRHIYDYVFTDSKIEQAFVKELGDCHSKCVNGHNRLPLS